MGRYVVGIRLSSNLDEVLLIKKNRPEWQSGAYNCPGGKVEFGETPLEAICREYLEETGVEIPPYDWALVLYLEVDVEGETREIFFFTSQGKLDFEQATDEELVVADTSALPVPIVANLLWIIPYCRYCHENGNVIHLSLIESERTCCRVVGG